MSKAFLDVLKTSSLILAHDHFLLMNLFAIRKSYRRLTSSMLASKGLQNWQTHWPGWVKLNRKRSSYTLKFLMSNKCVRVCAYVCVNGVCVRERGSMPVQCVMYKESQFDLQFLLQSLSFSIEAGSLSWTQSLLIQLIQLISLLLGSLPLPLEPWDCCPGILAWPLLRHPSPQTLSLLLHSHHACPWLLPVCILEGDSHHGTVGLWPGSPATWSFVALRSYPWEHFISNNTVVVRDGFRVW